MNEKVKVAREDKLTEAKKRLEKLAVGEEVIQSFLMHDLTPISFNGMDNIYGLNKEAVDRIKAFEENYNALVYYVIFAPTGLGDMESYLFVSDYEEEWDMDHEDLVSGYAMTWTENLDHPEWSEFGSISFAKTRSGALRRTG